MRTYTLSIHTVIYDNKTIAVPQKIAHGSPIISFTTQNAETLQCLRRKRQIGNAELSVQHEVDAAHL